jgi:amphi-Trp domain-containing protein
MSTPELDIESEAHDTPETDVDPDEEGTDPKRKAKGKIKFESVMQRSEAVAYFGALVDGLRHGKLQFRYGEEDLALNPSEQVLVEVKASKKGDKERVAFELEWRRTPETQVDL